MRPSLALALAAIGLFATGWWAAPAPQPDTALVEARRDAWTLPELPRRPDQVAAALGLATSPLFEPEAAQLAAAAAAAPPEDRRWRVIGVVDRGGERKALIGFALPGKETLRLRVGDKLPSGERISRISEGEVWIRVGRQQVPLGAQYRE